MIQLESVRGTPSPGFGSDARREIGEQDGDAGSAEARARYRAKRYYEYRVARFMPRELNE